MSNLPRDEIGGSGRTHIGEATAAIEPHVLTIEGHDCVIEHVEYFMVAELDGRIAVMVADPPRHSGMLFVPGIAEARHIAASLLRVVEQIEARAATEATAALARAADAARANDAGGSGA